MSFCLKLGTRETVEVLVECQVCLCLLGAFKKKKKLALLPGDFWFSDWPLCQLV